MQKFLLKFTGLAMAFAIIFATGCTDDTTGDDTKLPPLVRFESGVGFLSTDSDVEVGLPFSVQLTAQTGDADLNSLTINKDGSKLPLSELDIVVASTGEDVTNNPLLLVNTLASGFTLNITITPSTDVDDVNEYTFIVSDKNSETDEVSITITTVAPPGTPLSMELTGALLNQAGPTNTGGLSLNDGNGNIGSQNTAAEIRDMGIDCTINPAQAENWRKQFGSVNGSVIRRVDASQIEGFEFDKVDTKEVIVDAYDTGITLSSGQIQNPQCDVTASVSYVSGAVAVGDMFVVLNNGVYYLIEVAEINAVNGTNGDNWKFNIKY